MESNIDTKIFTRREKLGLPVVCFLLTLLTTLAAGAYMTGVDPLSHPIFLLKGIPFSLALLTILFAHEMGHYIFAKRWGVDVSLPLFLPGLVLPPPYISIGTFGAFISLRSKVKNNNALFDIGISGPIAGLIVSIAALILGMSLSTVIPKPIATEGMQLGNSLLLDLFSYGFWGVSSDRITIILHPIGVAGWFGFFITMLNLIPVGQLDGGHVIFTLFGRWQALASKLIVGLLLILGLVEWEGWIMWAFLLILMGVEHPPITQETTRLSKKRKIIAAASAIGLLLIFLPEPFIFKV